MNTKLASRPQIELFSLLMLVVVVALEGCFRSLFEARLRIPRRPSFWFEARLRRRRTTPMHAPSLVLCVALPSVTER